MVRNITSEWPPPPSISISICSTEGLLVGETEGLLVGEAAIKGLLVGEVAIEGRGHFWSERDNSLQMSWLVLRNAWFDFKDPRRQNNLSQIKYSSISQDTWLNFLLSTYSMLLETHVGLIFKKYFQVLWVTLSAKQLKLNSCTGIFARKYCPAHRCEVLGWFTRVEQAHHKNTESLFQPQKHITVWQSYSVCPWWRRTCWHRKRGAQTLLQES